MFNRRVLVLGLSKGKQLKLMFALSSLYWRDWGIRINFKNYDFHRHQRLTDHEPLFQEILCWTWCQCNYLSTEVICSDLDVLVTITISTITILAKEFWSTWSFSNLVLVIPRRVAGLALSSVKFAQCVQLNTTLAEGCDWRINLEISVCPGNDRINIPFITFPLLLYGLNCSSGHSAARRFSGVYNQGA